MNRNILIAILLAIVVIGGGAAYYLTAQNGEEMASMEPAGGQASEATASDTTATEETATPAPAPKPAPASVTTSDEEVLLAPHVLGDPDAPVTIIEYASLTCPHCAAFHRETFPQLKEKYIDTGKVKLESRDFPLDERAALATLLAHCVPEDRYFPLIGLLFEQQHSWAVAPNLIEQLKKMGGFAGLSPEDADACFNNQALYDKVLGQRKIYSDSGAVSSTPTFYVNGSKIVGAQPFATFEEAIEAALN